MNGVAIIEKNEAGTTTTVIEQEELELARLRALAKKHRAEVELEEQKAEAEKALQEQKAEADRRKANEEATRNKAYNRSTLKHLLICMAVAGFVIWCWTAALIHPILAFPIAIASLLIGSERLGEWRGKRKNKEDKPC